MIRRTIFSFVLVASVLAGVLFAPLSTQPARAEAAPNGCGPSALYLYTLIPNTISYWHFWRGWETFNFTNACNAHDICYDGSGVPRSTCDSRFLNDMLSVCSRGWTWGSRTWCNTAAYTYYSSVVTFGWIAYTP